jgi:high-affinity Fe2+/Pb2+ permease
MNHIGQGDKIAWGEGIMYGLIFSILIATIFIITILINIAFKKDQYKFYLWLCLAIIVLPIIVFNF